MHHCSLAYKFVACHVRTIAQCAIRRRQSLQLFTPCISADTVSGPCRYNLKHGRFCTHRWPATRLLVKARPAANARMDAQRVVKAAMATEWGAGGMARDLQRARRRTKAAGDLEGQDDEPAPRRAQQLRVRALLVLARGAKSCASSTVAVSAWRSMGGVRHQSQHLGERWRVKNPPCAGPDMCWRWGSSSGGTHVTCHPRKPAQTPLAGTLPAVPEGPHKREGAGTLHKPRNMAWRLTKS